MKLFVGNLPKTCPERTLTEAFARFGPCQISVFVSFTQGKFAFVEFDETLHAAKAKEAWDQQLFLGSQLKVSKVQARTAYHIPQSLSTSSSANDFYAGPPSIKNAQSPSVPGFFCTPTGLLHEARESKGDAPSPAVIPEERPESPAESAHDFLLPLPSPAALGDLGALSSSEERTIQSFFDCPAPHHAFIEENSLEKHSSFPFADREHALDQAELQQSLRKSTRARRAPQREDMVFALVQRNHESAASDRDEGELTTAHS